MYFRGLSPMNYIQHKGGTITCTIVNCCDSKRILQKLLKIKRHLCENTPPALSLLVFSDCGKT